MADNPANPQKPSFKPKTAPVGVYILVAAFAGGLSRFFLPYLPNWFWVGLFAILAVIYLSLGIWAKNRLRRTARNSQ